LAKENMQFNLVHCLFFWTKRSSYKC